MYALGGGGGVRPKSVLVCMREGECQTQKVHMQKKKKCSNKKLDYYLFYEKTESKNKQSVIFRKLFKFLNTLWRGGCRKSTPCNRGGAEFPNFLRTYFGDDPEQVLWSFQFSCFSSLFIMYFVFKSGTFEVNISPQIQCETRKKQEQEKCALSWIVFQIIFNIFHVTNLPFMKMLLIVKKLVTTELFGVVRLHNCFISSTLLLFCRYRVTVCFISLY